MKATEQIRQEQQSKPIDKRIEQVKVLFAPRILKVIPPHVYHVSASK
jgi:hypothetical protein